MLYVIIAFLGIIGLLFFQSYFQYGEIWPIFYFIGLIILFLVKQYLEDKELKNRH